MSSDITRKIVDINSTTGKNSKYRPSYFVKKSQYKRTHLLSLSWAQRWDDVQHRIRTHAEEARHINQSLRTSLHLCMFGLNSLPTSVVVELLGANQYAVIHRDISGWTPIHYACQFGVDSEILTLLLCTAVSLLPSSSSSPPAAHQQRSIAEQTNPRTILDPPSPLFLCCNRNCDIQTLSVLLEYSLTYPNEIGWWIAPITGAERYDDKDTWESTLGTHNSMITNSSTAISMYVNSRTSAVMNLPSDEADGLDTDNEMHREEVDNFNLDSNLTPLEVLWSRFPSNRMWRHEDGTRGIITTHSNKENSEDFTLFWEKIIHILSFHESRMQFQKGHVAETSSPKYQIDKTPSSINDRKGLLHHACSLVRPIPTFVQFILKLYPHQTLDMDSSGNLPLHHTILALCQQQEGSICPRGSPKGFQVFRDVLASNTVASSIPNKDKRYPLFLAIESSLLKWEAGIDDLVSAAPFVLRTMDVSTRLYPFMLAAAVAKDSSGVSITFTLLKRCPEISSLGLSEA